jgi:aspartyl-tRNA(Asn)/glutamyl-tRNA(Gln) amidotransferase subunit B
MSNKYEPVIGLEVHAVLETNSKMFCDCPVVDSTHDQPNSAVCPVCSGMPGVLPVLNKRAVEFALRVAIALNCEIYNTSIFARKSYFYPDLPKGYQISQYEQPLARNGTLPIETSAGRQDVRVRRVHLEEDTGKLTHIQENGSSYSLVDLNRSGIPLLEIVTEPDLHSVEAVKAYAFGLRVLLRYLAVNSGNLEKGLFRIEPNISIRPTDTVQLGTRVEIKNLNSFRSLERGVAYELERQADLINAGESVVQQTLGWDDENQVTVPQRSKEDAEDYRYFPEPDLPPLVITDDWIAEIKSALPELPFAKYQRFQESYGLNSYDANVLTTEKEIAEYYEAILKSAPDVSPKIAANWVSGELFNLMNQANKTIADLALTPQAVGELIQLVANGEINQNSGKTVLAEMFTSGGTAAEVVEKKGLKQISDSNVIAELVEGVLSQNAEQVENYLAGKDNLSNWLFGQVMRSAKGQANPDILQVELEKQLTQLKSEH